MLLGIGSVAGAAATLAGDWERLSEETREGVRAVMIAQRLRRGGAAEAVPPLPGAPEVEIARLRGDPARLQRALDRFEAEAAAVLVRTERERARVLTGAALLSLVMAGFGAAVLLRPRPPVPPPPTWEALFESHAEPLVVLDPEGRPVRSNAAARALPPAEPDPEPPEPAKPVQDEADVEEIPAAALELDEHLRVWLRCRVGVQVFSTPEDLPEEGLEALLVDLDSGPPVTREALRGLPVLCIADHPSEHLDRFLELEALGLVGRRESAGVLRRALSRVARGETVLGREGAAALRDRAVHGRRPPESSGLHELTARECDIFHLIVQGLSNKEIGDRLYISEGTVKTHVNRMLRKLDLKDRVGVLLFAAQNDLLPGRVQG